MAIIYIFFALFPLYWKARRGVFCSCFSRRRRPSVDTSLCMWWPNILSLRTQSRLGVPTCPSIDRTNALSLVFEKNSPTSARCRSSTASSYLPFFFPTRSHPTHLTLTSSSFCFLMLSVCPSLLCFLICPSPFFDMCFFLFLHLSLS